MIIDSKGEERANIFVNLVKSSERIWDIKRNKAAFSLCATGINWKVD